jgi:hypothetical protein
MSTRSSIARRGCRTAGIVPREQVRQVKAAWQLSLLRNAPRRSKRCGSPRAPARAACCASLCCLVEHDDSRGINSLDMLESADGRSSVKHYMFDFGSILGSGTVFAQRHRSGNEYIFEQKPGWLIARHPRALRSTLDDGGLSSRAALGWTDRSAALRSTELETRVPQPAFDNMRPTMRSGLRESCRNSRTNRFAR